MTATTPTRSQQDWIRLIAAARPGSALRVSLLEEAAFELGMAEQALSRLVLQHQLAAAAVKVGLK